MKKFLLLFYFLIPTTAFSVDPIKLPIDLAVFTGGFHALSVSGSIDIDENNIYHAHAHVEPFGWLGRLLPWGGSYQVYGHKTDHFIPKKFEKSNEWQGDITKTIITYTPEGHVETARRVEFDNNIKTRDYPHEDATKIGENSIDLLTAIFALLDQTKKQDNCNNTISVFDGKRRYNIVLKFIKTETLESSKYNSYDGLAMKCQFNIVPQAGWQEKDYEKGFYALQKATQDKGKNPIIWIGETPQGLKIPVKILFESDFGAVIAHYRNS